MFACDGVNRYGIVLFSHHKYLFGSFELMLNLLTCILIDLYFKIVFMSTKICRCDNVTELRKRAKE